MKITTSGVFCAVTITNVLPKDSGKWYFNVGTGQHLVDFASNLKQFVYHVDVEGTDLKFKKSSFSSLTYYYDIMI